MFRILSTVVLLTGATAAAASEWTYQSGGAAFSSDQYHFAMTLSGNAGLGVRCDDDELDMVFITPEMAATPQDIAAANANYVRLVIDTGDGDPKRLIGALTLTDEGQTMMTAPAMGWQLEFLDALSSNPTASVQIEQDAYYSVEFGNEGVAEAIATLRQECPTDLWNW